MSHIINGCAITQISCFMASVTISAAAFAAGVCSAVKAISVSISGGGQFEHSGFCVSALDLTVPSFESWTI